MSVFSKACCFLGFHKWITTSKSKCRMKRLNVFSGESVDVVGVAYTQKCQCCGCSRGMLTDSQGNSNRFSVEFIESNVKGFGENNV
jgi:hypothetical protein